MSHSSDKILLFLVKMVFIPAVIVKFLYSLSMFYLDKDLVPISNSGNISFITKTKLAYKILDTTKEIKEEVVQSGKKITDFKLKGTYVAGDDSFVIIEDGANTEFIYMGESYQGYKLIKVYENKAIFDRDGTTYELNMYNGEDIGYTTNEPIRKRAKKPSMDGEYVVPIDLDKEDVNYYVQNPDKIWNNIRIRDYRTQNGIEFKVGYIRKGTIFDKIGLRQGDIITAIDGQTPQSMADVMRYYNQINDIDSLILTIKRDGQEMDLEFRIKE